MSYKNWKGSRASLAVVAAWYNAESLMGKLLNAKQVYFDERRGFDFQILYSIFFYFKRQSPYKYNMRFWEDGKFVCDIVGKWNLNFSKLREIYADKKNSSGFDKTTLQLVRKIILEMIDDLMSGSSVFDRETFEKWAGVVWSEDENPLGC